MKLMSFIRKTEFCAGRHALAQNENKTLGTAIDLCDLGLDQIDEDENEFRIGAYATLRQIETHEALNAYTHGAIAESVRHIVGVQFRNVATVGGSIWGRFGFSDVMTISGHWEQRCSFTRQELWIWTSLRHFQEQRAMCLCQ